MFSLLHFHGPWNKRLEDWRCRNIGITFGSTTFQRTCWGDVVNWKAFTENCIFQIVAGEYLFHHQTVWGDIQHQFQQSVNVNQDCGVEQGCWECALLSQSNNSKVRSWAISWSDGLFPNPFFVINQSDRDWFVRSVSLLSNLDFLILNYYFQQQAVADGNVSLDWGLGHFHWDKDCHLFNSILLLLYIFVPLLSWI